MATREALVTECYVSCIYHLVLLRQPDARDISRAISKQTLDQHSRLKFVNLSQLPVLYNASKQI
jgi:hypothetical protein